MLCKNEEKLERISKKFVNILLFSYFLDRKAQIDKLAIGEELVGEQKALVKEFLIEKNY